VIPDVPLPALLELVLLFLQRDSTCAVLRDVFVSTLEPV
jgi:hypothetical protein